MAVEQAIEQMPMPTTYQISDDDFDIRQAWFEQQMDSKDVGPKKLFNSLAKTPASLSVERIRNFKLNKLTSIRSDEWFCLKRGIQKLSGSPRIDF